MAAARRERSGTRQAAVWDQDLPGGSWARAPVAPAGAQAAVHASPRRGQGVRRTRRIPRALRKRRAERPIVGTTPRRRAPSAGPDPCLTEARASAARAPASYGACGRGRPRPTPTHDSAESGVPPSPVAPARAPPRPTARHLRSAPGVAPGHHPRIAAHDRRIATTGRGASPREAPRRPRRRMRACGRARTGSALPHRTRGTRGDRSPSGRRRARRVVSAHDTWGTGGNGFRGSPSRAVFRPDATCTTGSKRKGGACSGFRGAMWRRRMHNDARAAFRPGAHARAARSARDPTFRPGARARTALRIRRFGLERADDLGQPLV